MAADGVRTRRLGTVTRAIIKLGIGIFNHHFHKASGLAARHPWHDRRSVACLVCPEAPESCQDSNRNLARQSSTLIGISTLMPLFCGWRTTKLLGRPFEPARYRTCCSSAQDRAQIVCELKHLVRHGDGCLGPSWSPNSFVCEKLFFDATQTK
jgi:hypothetical protein